MGWFSRTRVRYVVSVMAVGAGLAMAGLSPCLASGGAENVLLIINPMDKDSLLVGNYYRLRRDIPASNVLYLTAATADYQQFADENVRALLGSLANRQLEDHIDYIVVAPGSNFFVTAPGLVSDSCSPVTRFATSSAFTMAHITDSVRAGGNFSTRTNRYFSATNIPLGFDSNIAWFSGEPSDRSDAERYFIGAMLGYTGTRGNTVSEVLDMIDRSVAADGTHPLGTFYFMKTNDVARSGPRDGLYPIIVSEILARGGQAENRCCDPLPTGEQDVLGLLTGAATLDIEGANMTILPGAYCDHLTSYAGTFDNGSQTKMSRWIANGASGTTGTVEEPCNYPGKFPQARMQLYYYQGLTLGESVLRSVAYIPYQLLLLGDPITQPFTYIPQVDVVDAPVDPVSGVITLTPSATTNHPTARIDHFDLLLDGVLVQSVGRNRTFSLDTRRYADGYHDLRVLAYDDSDVRATGRWVGSIMINNNIRNASISCNRSAGNYDSRFNFTVEGFGTPIAEFRVILNGRVLGATTQPLEPILIYGATLGAGDVYVQGEVLYTDGRKVRTEPLHEFVWDDPGAPTVIAPVAHSYTKYVLAGEPFLLELPGTFNQFSPSLGFEVLTPPSQSTIISTTPGPYRVCEASPNATGTDSLTFRWTHPNGDSNTATVTLIYEECNLGQPQLAVSRLVGGQSGRFTVTCAWPNEQTHLGYSLQGLGSTYVPQLNVTIGLRNPTQAGSPKTTDANGSVTWNLPIPNINPRTVWFQAAQRAAVSNVVETQIE
ncbi:MAG: hypothetical protein IT430_14045 [Phycisphaerales bacterium]|nr:hypothetical protein [Phycisphaerales bacterium]